jgi:putative transposase
VKTVPTVHLADPSDVAAFSELPTEVRLGLSDIAGAAREGLLAMSVAAGLAVMQAMFDSEITAVAGP